MASLLWSISKVLLPGWFTVDPVETESLGTVSPELGDGVVSPGPPEVINTKSSSVQIGPLLIPPHQTSITQSVQFSSVTQLCPTLCDLMNGSTPGLPVHHQLPDFTQTHFHQVSDAIQPSHPRSSTSPPAPIPPSIRVFSNESTLHMRWPKYWSFSFSIIPSKEHPGLISFRMDWLDLLAVQGTLKSLL